MLKVPCLSKPRHLTRANTDLTVSLSRALRSLPNSTSSPDIYMLKADLFEIPESVRREEVELWASNLTSFLVDGRTDKGVNLQQKSMLPKEVMEKIQTWVKVPSSRVLWIQGPIYATMAQQLSRAAIQLCDSILTAGMPCISFFPKSRYDFQQESSSSSVSSRETVLTAMLYSLVGQLVHLLPSEFESNSGINQKAFQDLDRSVGSIPAALQLIGLLLYHAPPHLIVIIDKLHLVDSQETRPILIRLSQLFRDLGSRQMVKVLYTTAGTCGALVQMTKLEERVNATRMVQLRPGQPLRGWSSMANLRATDQGW